jgi:hypothetical protein
MTIITAVPVSSPKKAKSSLILPPDLTRASPGYSDSARTRREVSGFNDKALEFRRFLPEIERCRTSELAQKKMPSHPTERGFLRPSPG